MTRAPADRLATRLRTAELPGEAAARERAWTIVAAAYEAREPAAAAPRRAGLLAVIAAAACLIVAAVAIAVTPAGEAVGDWLRDVVRPAPQRTPAHPALGPLPGRGRLLVAGPTGPWIVQRDGSRRRLGSYDDATFSPHGLFVAATRGRVLAAVDPRGGVRWSRTAADRVTHPAWSPDGFRIAYRAGGRLRVVYGDGANDRPLAPRSSAVTPAWRPGTAAHRLAYVAGSTTAVALRDADTGRELWRTRLAAPVHSLAWARNGRRLLAVSRESVTLLDARGRVLRTLAMPAGSRATAAGWLPASTSFALLRTRAGASEVVLVRASRPARRVLALPGRLAGMLVSPDGRWLLLSAPEADQWLLVRSGAGGRIAARSDVARQFDPAARSPGRAPRPLGWIG